VNDKQALGRVFIDANILIAGANSRSGASRAVLLMGEIGLIQLIVSHQVLVEAERNIRKKLPQALPLNTKDFTDEVARQTNMLIQTPAKFIQEIRFIVQTGLDS